MCGPRRAGGPWPGVLLCIDAIGLRPRIEEMATRIASWGYVVLAPNTLYRSGTAAETRPTGDLHEPGAREAFMRGAMSRVSALTASRMRADAAAYLEALRERPAVAAGPLGVTGYCMGARLAVYAACERPDLVAACGGFHGGRLATDAPDSPHRGIASATAEFVFGHADQDASMSPDDVAELGRALRAAGLSASNEIYPGAAHGYTMSDTPMFHAEATERHFAELRALFARALGSAEPLG